MKRLAPALVLALALLAPSLAFGQCTGVFLNNTVCGNVSGAAKPPGMIAVSSLTFGLTINSTTVSGATAGQILYSDGTKLQAGGAVKTTSLALGGCTIGSNALCATGTANISGIITGGQVTAGTAVRAYSGGMVAGVNGFTATNAAVDGEFLGSGGLSIISSDLIKFWSGTNLLTGAYDTNINRASAGVLQVGTTAANALGSLNLASLTATAASSIAGLTVTSSFTATGLVANASLATMATNTIHGNATSGTASPTNLAIGSCDGATKALQWTTNTGFGCSTSITAATITVGTTAVASGTTTRILYNNAGTLGEYTLSGTGTVVAMATSPAFTTPSLGAATASSINGNTFTSGTYTLTGVAGKTLTFNKSITLEGTDATTWTGASTSMTLAALNIAGQTLTGGANVTSGNLGTVSSGTTTLNCGTVPLQYLTNNGAFTLAAPANDGSCILRVTNGASAGTITFSGWTVGSNTGDSYATTNTNRYDLFVRRINSVTSYQWSALQ